GKQIRFIARRALAALAAHDWPGNVRELAHALQSAVMLADHDRIALEVLPDYLWDRAMAADSASAVAPADQERLIAQPGETSQLSLDQAVSQASKSALLRALQEADGNCHRAAQLLGVSRYTVYRMIARYGLARRVRNPLGMRALTSAEA
ncbi:MAG: helix-turn-helix domain-containing protein, partial [Candidatus Binataceae bacterium]